MNLLNLAKRFLSNRRDRRAIGAITAAAKASGRNDPDAGGAMSTYLIPGSQVFTIGVGFSYGESAGKSEIKIMCNPLTPKGAIVAYALRVVAGRLPSDARLSIVDGPSRIKA